VLDATGGDHGVASGSPAYTPGWAGNGMFFDGVDDYVALPAGVANSDDITIAAWVRWNGGAAWQRVFDFGDSTAANMFLTPMSADNTMRFAITTGGGATEQILDTEPMPIGPWVHLAVTLSGNTGLLYVNGAPRIGGRITLDPSDITPAFNYVGKSQYADPLFRGFIDDLRIYEYALTADEIAALTYNADFDGDGDIDDADLPRWNQNYGLTSGATRAQGDANGDGTVNGTDFLIWQRTRGTAAPNGAPVPEPRAAVLVALAVGLATRRRLPALSPLRGGPVRGERRRTA
jgi:hypothetical protein